MCFTARGYGRGPTYPRLTLAAGQQAVAPARLAEQPLGLAGMQQKIALCIWAAASYARLEKLLQQRSERGFSGDDVDRSLLARHLMHIHEGRRDTLTHQMDLEGRFDIPGTCEIIHETKRYRGCASR